MTDDGVMEPHFHALLWGLIDPDRFEAWYESTRGRSRVQPSEWRSAG